MTEFEALAAPPDWWLLRQLGPRVAVVAAPSDIWFKRYKWDALHEVRGVHPPTRLRAPVCLRASPCPSAGRRRPPPPPPPAPLDHSAAPPPTWQEVPAVESYWVEGLSHAFCVSTPQSQALAELVAPVCAAVAQQAQRREGRQLHASL